MVTGKARFIAASFSGVMSRGSSAVIAFDNSLCGGYGLLLTHFKMRLRNENSKGTIPF